MAAVVYVISEGTKPVPAEDYTSPTYILTDKAEMENYFEPWYVDEHYLCVDSEGRRYEFASDGKRIWAVEIEQSDKWRSQCLNMLSAWLNNTRDWIRAELGIPHDHVVGPDDVLRIIADESLVRKLAL